VSVGANPGPPALPPGTFRIDRDGVWRHEGQEVTHPGVLQNLYANLQVDAQGHYLQVGPSRIPVDLEDAPFVVTRVELTTLPEDPRQALRMCLSDGSVERLSPESLWIGSREIPYCRVKSGRFTARFTVSAWLQLAAFVEEGPQPGQTALVLSGVRCPLPRRD